VQIRRLWLQDFRSYREAEVPFAPGLTTVVGPNGVGKTNLLEAVAYLATLSSFRGAPVDALVRAGASEAVVRGDIERDDRELLVEALVRSGGRGRVQVNRQRLQRARDLLGALRVTVFSPDDLELVKGGPANRRQFVDDLLVSLHPRNDALRGEYERVVRQRNALLKQSGGRVTPEIETTLVVWDTKLVEAGEALARARQQALDELAPTVRQAYDDVARAPAEVTLTYDAPWRAEGLAAALVEVRSQELRRGVSLVGPHRDEVTLTIGGLPARTHASQGEQRSLALALRLGAHATVAAATETTPVLLLDDIFSELDPDRAEALVEHLPAGQTILSSAGGTPPGVRPDLVLRVGDGRVVAEPSR
jgi:DNA replication and repair protein RecF